jgi:transcriptional regulator with XRE-family HTH domain
MAVHPLIGACLVRRRQLGLTQAQVAARMHCTQGTVSDIERGRTSPGLATFERYLGVLGLRLAIMPEMHSRDPG